MEKMKFISQSFDVSAHVCNLQSLSADLLCNKYDTASCYQQQ